MVTLKNVIYHDLVSDDKGKYGSISVNENADRMIRIFKHKNPTTEQDVKKYKLHIYPGLIDAHSHITLTTYNNDESNSSFSNQINLCCISDSFNPFSNDMLDALRSGISISHICPGSGSLISGYSALVKIDRFNVMKSVIKDKVSLKMSLGSNPVKYNRENTQMELAESFRLFMKETNYVTENLTSGKIPLKIHCHSPQSIMLAFKLINEYGLRATLDHCTGIRSLFDRMHHTEIKSLLKSNNVDFILGPLMGGKTKIELSEKSFETCNYLRDIGINFSLSTDSCTMYPASNLLLQARILKNQYGWSSYDVLKTITINPAKTIFDVDYKKYSTIQTNSLCDLIICDGELLDFDTEIIGAVIDGKQIDFYDDYGFKIDDNRLISSIYE